jgi:hypothetical protein
MPMPASVLYGTSDAQQFLAAVDRNEEMARLQAQAQRRKPMLIFGPEGVGKTRLIEAFLKTQPLALHVPKTQSPREILLALVQELRRTAQNGITLPTDPALKGTGALKAIVQRALDQAPYLLVMDHLAGPSRVVTGLIKDLNYYDRTPVVFAARTPHMEDIGALQPMCARKSECLELKEFLPPVALEFVRREAERSGLQASNLNEVLHSLVEWSNGNPGSLIHMVRMARLPRYRTDDQIKAHVLYIDYRMGRRD